MRAIDMPGADANGGGINLIDVQVIQGQHTANDVDDGVDGAHLVERDIIHGFAVDLGFHFGQVLEDGQ